MNKYANLLLSLKLCLFYPIILLLQLSKKSSAFHHQYQACLLPRNCGQGPNISFPFYIQNLQESYCGYPGFNLSCRNDLPILTLSDNDYVVENIFYENHSLQVYNAVLLNNADRCAIIPRIRNTTLDSTRFHYVNETGMHIFSNCTPNFRERNNVFPCDEGGREEWNVVLYDGDDGPPENCSRNVVAPVEWHEWNGSEGEVLEVLRRGVVLNWIASNCSHCESSGGRCGFNESVYQFKCFCTDRPHSGRCRPERRQQSRVILISALSGGGVLLIFLTISFVFWLRKKRIKTRYFLSRNISTDPSSKSEAEVGSCYYGIPIFCYLELEEATNNFDPSKELGDGGFGTVYHGILRDGREVAIKRLYEHNCKRVDQFMNEIKLLHCLKHPNLVTLYGCTSRRSRELLLIYEYIPNGTVADHLHGERAKESPLTWPMRMNIAIETASALAYLHKSDIVHRDVKTTNILLDGNFHVKVADFGLSRIFPADVTHISTAPQGTPGYVDPEYHQCYQLTDRSDVYSFGVVLVELISSMPAVDIARHRHEINLANLAINRIQRCEFDELIDSSLGYKTDSEVMRMTTSVAELAFQCLQLEKDMRPSMDEVLNVLRDIKRGGKIPPSPETDDVELLKKQNLLCSPTAVIGPWLSSGSTTMSSVDS